MDRKLQNIINSRNPLQVHLDTGIPTTPTEVGPKHQQNKAINKDKC